MSSSRPRRRRDPHALEVVFPRAQVIAIDPDAHVDGFAARAASIVKTVASSHPAGVRLPGDGSLAIEKKNRIAGCIPVPKRIWDVICATSKKQSQ